MTWLIFYIVILAALIGLLIRNELTYRYRTNLLKRVSEVGQREIDNGILDKWRARYRALDSVNYHEMVWKFWKKFDSFYDDKDFNWEGK